MAIGRFTARKRPTLSAVVAAVAVAAVAMCLLMSGERPKPPQLPEPSIKLIVTPHLLYPIHGAMVEYKASVSDDGRHVAVPVCAPVELFRAAMNLDGQAGKMYESIPNAPVFSPDGRHLSYWAHQGGKDVIVRDGVEGGAYDNQGHSFPIIFSPDSQHLAFDAERAGKFIVVVDGVEREFPDFSVASGDNGHLYQPIFSPDSHHIAYAAQRGTQWFMVEDGREGAPYDWVGPPAFSAADNRLAYIARNAGKYMIVSDGKNGKAYTSIGPSSLVFSPDGRHSAFAARNVVGAAMVILDGVAGPPFDRIGENEPVSFSADGRHFAYWAKRGSRWFVVQDGVSGFGYSDYPMFSPTAPQFSSDGLRLAYAVNYPNAGGEWQGLGPAATGFVVVDGAQGTPYRKVSGPIFSPDCHHVAYTASGGMLAIDGAAIKAYRDDDVFPPSNQKVIFFDGPSSLHTFDLQSNGIYRLDVNIVPK